MSLPTREQRQANEHHDEWSHGWQYATVYRTVRDLHTEQERNAVRKGAPPAFFKPPEGDGWEPNTDKHRGLDVSPPSWCKDGSVLMQRLYWRRPMPGMAAFHAKAHLSVNRDTVSA